MEKLIWKVLNLVRSWNYIFALVLKRILEWEAPIFPTDCVSLFSPLNALSWWKIIFYRFKSWKCIDQKSIVVFTSTLVHSSIILSTKVVSVKINYLTFGSQHSLKINQLFGLKDKLAQTDLKLQINNCKICIWERDQF